MKVDAVCDSVSLRVLETVTGGGEHGAVYLEPAGRCTVFVNGDQESGVVVKVAVAPVTPEGAGHLADGLEEAARALRAWGEHVCTGGNGG